MCFRYSEAVSTLYKNNVFDCMNPSTIRRLHASILPDRWMIIQSLQVHWNLSGLYWTVQDGSVHFIVDKDSWESECRAIKTLRALRHFTLVLTSCRMGHNFDTMLNLLKPLKDLCLRYPWELRICCSQDDLRTAEVALKGAGFNCFVTSTCGQFCPDLTLLDSADILESFDFDSFLNTDDTTRFTFDPNITYSVDSIV